MTEANQERQSSVLALARTWRRRGWADRAVAVLETALQQPQLKFPTEPVVVDQVAWLELELASLRRERGDLKGSDQLSLQAIARFERGGNVGGQVVAALSVADTSWQAGHASRAQAWYERSVTMAREVDNPQLIARCCLSLANMATLALEPQRAERYVEEAEEVSRTEREFGSFSGSLSGLLGDELERELRHAQVVTEASVALARARQAARAGRWSATRLTLDAAAEAARSVEAWELYIETLRLDAAVARQRGDPRSAVEALTSAAELADRLSMLRLGGALRAECVLALADNEQWQAAFELQSQSPSAELMAQPAIHAAKLDGFAVLSLHAGNFSAAERAVAESRQLKRDSGDALGALRSGLLLAETRRRAGELDAVVSLLDEINDDVERSGRADIMVASQLMRLEVSAHRLVDPLSWRDDAVATVTMADEAGTSAQQIVARDLASAAYQGSGETADARRLAEEALRLAEEQPLIRWRARARARLAATFLAAQEPILALEEAERAGRLSAQAHDAISRARSLLVAGLAMLRIGRLDEAQLALGEAAAEATAVQQAALATEASLAQGEVFLRLARPREALHGFQQAESHALRAGSASMQARALRGAASALMAGGDAPRAATVLNRASQLCEGPEALLCVVDLARLEVLAGAPERGLKRLEELDEQGLTEQVRGEVALVRAQGLTVIGQGAEALTYARSASESLRPQAGRSFGAALFAQGQLEVAFGDPAVGGRVLAEALTITAELGLPEQHSIREALERYDRVAKTAP